MRKVIEEVREIIEGEQGSELTAKVTLHKNTGQFSVKIPKRIAERARLTGDEIMRFRVELDKSEHGEMVPRLFAEVVDDEQTDT